MSIGRLIALWGVENHTPLFFSGLKMRNILRLSKAITRPIASPGRCNRYVCPTKTQLFPTSRPRSTYTSIRALSTTTFPTSTSYTADVNSSLLSSHSKQNILLQNNLRLLPKAFVRYCSHHRMCQQRGLSADTPGSVVDITSGREILPANVKPKSYNLTLEPDLEKFTFEGKVTIW